MRIISGHARRIQLQTPAGRDLRPTSDRVKETLFAMLEPLAELRVLDLFAGTGALGLEALSRGAADVVFVEHNSRHVRLIEENLAAVRKAFGAAPTGTPRIVTADVRQTARRLPDLAGKFDFILADPPYHPGPAEYGGDALLRDPEFAAWAGPEVLLVLEHEDGTEPPWAPASLWRLVKQRRVGDTVLSFARTSQPH